jgi:hypothetical protein
MAVIPGANTGLFAPLLKVVIVLSTLIDLFVPDTVNLSHLFLPTIVTNVTPFTFFIVSV